MRKRTLLGRRRSKGFSLAGRRTYIALLLLSILAGVSAYALITYGSIQPPIDGVLPTVLRAFATYQGAYVGVPVTVAPGSYSGTTSIDPSNPLKWEVPASTYTVSGTYNGDTKSPSVTVLQGQVKDVILAFGTIVPPPASAKHTFTWISCAVNQGLISWAKSLHITDVILRTYFRLGDAQQDYSLFTAAGLNFWCQYNWFDVEPTMTVAGLSAQLITWRSTTPGGHVYLDDCHHILTYGSGAFAALLDAVRAVQTIDSEGRSNFILCVYAGSYSGYNFANLDIDWYAELSTSYSSIPIVNAASVGGYVWSYRSGWDGISSSQVQTIYQDCTSLGYVRMTVWTGYEPDESAYFNSIGNPQEAARMDAANLYLHTNKNTVIHDCNVAFLAS